MQLVLPLTKGHLSNVVIISLAKSVALLERDYCNRVELTRLHSETAENQN